ncbi:hypothetical protein ENBRE01_1856 [Enteropsectra breve]|nr:hypothetical protein ENBRE01_1856 [Enteropsectra breve]
MVLDKDNSVPDSIEEPQKDVFYMTQRAATIRKLDIATNRIPYSSAFIFLLIISTVIIMEFYISRLSIEMPASLIISLLHIPFLFGVIVLFTLFSSFLASVIISKGHTSEMFALFASSLIYAPLLILISFLTTSIIYQLAVLANAMMMSFYLVNSLGTYISGQRLSLFMNIYCFILQFLIPNMLNYGLAFAYQMSMRILS